MTPAFGWQTGTLPMKDGTNLFLRKHLIPDSSRTVLIVHGLGEHGGRYDPLASALDARGYSVYVPDLRGHGKSPGQRGHIDRWDNFLDDVARLIAHIAAARPGGKIILLGHSLGGLIAITAAHLHHQSLTALVLSSPCLELARPPAAALEQLVGLLSRFVPRLPLKNRVDPRKLSHVESEVQAYRQDPLVHSWITPRLFCEIRSAMTRARNDVRIPHLPVLLLVAGADQICRPRTAEEWFRALASETKTCKVYPQAYHEVLKDRERDEMLDDIVSWLDGRFS